MVRTFLDAGVLSAAGRSVSLDRERALRILRLAKAFYDEYFNAAEWFRDLARIEAAAIEAAKSGLAAMDALHLAAHFLKADEFITTERT